MIGVVVRKKGKDSRGISSGVDRLGCRSKFVGSGVGWKSAKILEGSGVSSSSLMAVPLEVLSTR
jgi:hypothetical protein